MPGIGPSPNRMLLGRLFAYSEAHRARMGSNYTQIPVNRPQAPVNSYTKDGHLRIDNVADPVYAPNSYGGPVADTATYGEPAGWEADGDMVRSAQILHAEDDDWGQAGTLVRDVLDDDARDRLVDNIVGHLSDGVSDKVLDRAFAYWRNVDKDLGHRRRRRERAARRPSEKGDRLRQGRSQRTFEEAERPPDPPSDRVGRPL